MSDQVGEHDMWKMKETSRHIHTLSSGTLKSKTIQQSTMIEVARYEPMYETLRKKDW